MRLGHVLLAGPSHLRFSLRPLVHDGVPRIRLLLDASVHLNSGAPACDLGRHDRT